MVPDLEDPEGKIAAAAVEASPLPRGDIALMALSADSFHSLRSRLRDKDSAELLLTFSQCVESRLPAFQGIVVAHRGDAYFIAFMSLDTAVRCAFAIEQELLHAPWQDELCSIHDELKTVVWRGVTVLRGLRLCVGHPSVLLDGAAL